jgi:hypothetical protein
VGSNGAGYRFSIGLDPFDAPRIRAGEVRGKFGEAPTETLVAVDVVWGIRRVILIIPNDLLMDRC